tara:strand:+ start:160 stop:450 length:291 start_codon:yes stop_codon:yes gene_type:complete
MKVTIHKTVYLDEVPDVVECDFNILEDRLIGAKQLLSEATKCADDGRYIDSSEMIERLRSALAMIDRNLEEQQSLCLSYENLRITSQMQEKEDADK